jgi:GNAT superfamily N-acetyltransferase
VTIKTYRDSLRAETIRALAEANFENHVAALDYRNRVYHRSFKEGEFVRASDDDCHIHWCRLGAGVFNIVYGARLGRNSTSSDARARVADITRRTSCAWEEPVRWFVSSVDTPRRLGELLEDEGWDVAYHWTEMGAHVQHIRVEPADPDVSILRVRDEKGRLDWMLCQCAGYDLAGPLAEFMDRLTVAFLAQSRQRFRLYLARSPEEEPVGTAALFVSDRTAGIYMVATDPLHRRKGIATALMRRIIADARRCGCTTCILQASAQALPLYENMGFHTTGETAIYRR